MQTRARCACPGLLSLLGNQVSLTCATLQAAARPAELAGVHRDDCCMAASSTNIRCWLQDNEAASSSGPPGTSEHSSSDKENQEQNLLLDRCGSRSEDLKDGKRVGRSSMSSRVGSLELPGSGEL